MMLSANTDPAAGVLVGPALPAPAQPPVIITGAGGKGGGKQRQPVETSDSLHSIAYAQVLDLISEGEIVGLVNGAQSVYLNGTPLQNADSTFNFERITLEQRTGTQYQSAIPGFPGAQQESGVGVQLDFGSPWSQAITNTDLSAVRIRLGVQALSQLDTSTGDLKGFRVEYQIHLRTDAGAWVLVVDGAFDGKTTALYERTHRIELPAAATDWTVRVTRTTPNANSASVADTVLVQSITTVVDAKLRYPMSALVGLKMDARQFSSVPTRAYHMRGRIIRVPSNYNPATRVYAGIWDGTWQLAYTNNPAWIFLDLVTNDRYGLGRLIPLAMVDKWSLYRIAVYCDDPVDNGLGGTEPRFTCNLYLQGREDAWKVISDLASTFRGIAYYAAGSVFASADMPTDPVYTYTQANVIDGAFEYQGSPRSTRATVALVSWNDLTDLGRAKVEAVDDPDGIARYGIRQVEMTAFGCTSQAQACRVGKWALLTARLETDTVSFAVGLDGALAVPGQIIKVADAARAGRRIGGRIKSATVNQIVTDAEVVAAPGDRLTIHKANGTSETRSVSSSVGRPFTIDNDEISIDTTLYSIDMTGLPATSSTLGVSPPFSEAPAAGTIWTIESSLLWAQTFRVMSVAENQGSSDGAKSFTINAVQHEPGKFPATDFGTIVQPRPISVIPPGVMAPPASVGISGYYVIEQGIANNVARIEVAPVPGAIAYEVEWRRNRSDWVRMPRSGATAFEIRGIYAGTYVARARAVNALDVPSIWTSSVETEIAGKTDPPPAVGSLTASTTLVFAIDVEWTFPAGPLDVARTELYRSPTSSFADAVKIGDFAYPTSRTSLQGLAAGAESWFWARLVDKSGNIGAFYPAADPGVRGQASSSAASILAYLAGQITATQLGTSLLTRIETGEAAAVQAQATTTDLAALYTIKTQINANGRTYVAGIGVGVENNAGVIESQVLVAASKFAVIDPNGTTVSAPFVITGGQVFIASAFIENGSITNAKIGDAQITTAKIGDAQVTNAKIGDAQVTNAKIGDAQISTAKIAQAQIDSLRIAGGAVTSTAYGTAGLFTLPGGGTLNLTSVVLDMGVGGGGVVLHGNIQAGGNFNTTVGLRIIRGYDGATLTDIRTSFIAGFAGGASVFAFDPAPTAGNNTYFLNVYNPPSGPGGGAPIDVGPSSLLAWGGKR